MRCIAAPSIVLRGIVAAAGRLAGVDIAADRDPRRTSERLPAVKPDALISAVWPGQPYPRGATWDGEGVNFSLFSANAQKIEL